MSTLNQCRDGGWLVGAGEPVGADASEFYGAATPGVLGCGALVCTRCGWPVRQGNGFLPQEGADAEALYAVADWSHSPAFTPEAPPVTHRVYVCRCTAWVTARAQALDAEDAEFGALVFPWRCGGHAPLSLPATVDGLVLTDATDLRGLVRSALAEGPPPGARAMDGRLFDTWVRRTGERLRGSPLQDRWDAAFVDLLADPSPRVRTGVLLYARALPEVQARRVLAWIAEHRDALRGVPDPALAGGTLLDRALHLVSDALHDGDTTARRIAREEAFTEGERTAVLQALAEEDAGWLIEHAVDADARVRGRWSDLLRAFARVGSPRLGELTARLLAAKVTDRVAIEAFAASLGWEARDVITRAVAAQEAHGYALPDGEDARGILRAVSHRDAQAEHLAQLWGRLDPGSCRALARHVVLLLDDPEPRVIAGALAFLRRVPAAPDDGALARRLDAGAAGLAGVPDPLAPWRLDLRESLVGALAERALAGDPTALAAVQAEALRPDGAEVVVDVLVRIAPAWLRGHLPALLDGSPRALAPVLRATRRGKGSVLQLLSVAAARMDPDVVRGAILAAIPAGPERDEALVLVPNRR